MLILNRSQINTHFCKAEVLLIQLLNNVYDVYVFWLDRVMALMLRGTHLDTNCIPGVLVHSLHATDPSKGLSQYRVMPSSDFLYCGVQTLKDGTTQYDYLQVKQQTQPQYS